jgi:prepilin-type N-terminal cleavage/methylation domain-containing protein
MEGANKNKKVHVSRQLGFSLIEFLIAVAIISIISVVSWIRLSDSKSATFAKQACEEAASAINKTRNFALSGKCSGGGATFVRIRISGNGGVISGGNGNCDETFSLPRATTCSTGTFTFGIPLGDGNTGSISCNITGGDASDARTVIVDNNKAYCQ